MIEDNVRLEAIEEFLVRLGRLVPQEWAADEVARLEEPGALPTSPARLRAAALIKVGQELRARREEASPGAQAPASANAPPPIETRNARLLDAFEREVAISKSYATVVTGAGYAALLAIWAGLRDHVDKASLLWSAVLISISVVSFVAWEMLKVGLTNVASAKYNQVVAAKFHDVDFEAAVGNVRAAASADATALNRYQPISFWLSTVTGFSAAGLLAWASMVAATHLKISFGP